MDTKHTSGPWFYQEGADAYTHIVRAGENRFLCQLSQDTTGESEANARLIAAAPDMLAALKAILTAGDGHDDFTDEWPTIRAAIAKAEGR